MFKCSLFLHLFVCWCWCDALLQVLRESKNLLNKMGPTAFINSQIVLK